MQIRHTLGLLTALGALALAGCEPDDCEALPSSFRLDVEVEGERASLPVRLLLIELDVPPDRYRQTFAVGDTLADHVTSVAIEIDPPLTETTEVGVRIVAYPGTSTASVPLGEDTSEFDVNPDGCNRFRFELNVD